MPRGRKKGSSSFVSLTQDQISDIFGPNALIKVSRVQVEELGFNIKENEKPELQPNDSIEIEESVESQPKIEIRQHKFED